MSTAAAAAGFPSLVLLRRPARGLGLFSPPGLFPERMMRASRRVWARDRASSAFGRWMSARGLMVGDGGSRLIETREPISTLDFFFIIAVVARRRRCQGVVCLVDHSAWCLRASSITCGHWNGIFQSAQRGNHPARGLGLVLDRAQSGGGSLTLDSFSPPPFLTHTTFQQQKKTYKLQVHTGLAKNARHSALIIPWADEP